LISVDAPIFPVDRAVAIAESVLVGQESAKEALAQSTFQIRLCATTIGFLVEWRQRFLSLEMAVRRSRL